MAVYGQVVKVLEDLFHVLLRYWRCIRDDHPLLLVFVAKLSDACSDLHPPDVLCVKKYLRDKGMTAAQVEAKWNSERAWWRRNKCIRKVIPAPAGNPWMFAQKSSHVAHASPCFAARLSVTRR